MQRESVAQAQKPDWTSLPQLNSARAPTKTIFATDEWFATCDNLNRVEEPVFDPDAFDFQGKVMDGWESRRRREAGHDWCIMKLGLSGVIKGFEVNTAFFTGNQVPRVSIQAVCLSQDINVLPEWNSKPRKGTKASPEEHAAIAKINSEAWDEIVPMSPLAPGYADCCKHYFPVNDERRFTHIRINYGPDGGIARIRCHGEVKVDWKQLIQAHAGNPVDLLASQNGGLGLMASNSHYGTPQNMLGFGRGVNMGDGWETARNPNRPPKFKTDANGMMELPGFDWCVLQLGTAGIVQALEIDTLHFKGNYPESFMMDGCFAPSATRTTFNPDAVQWTPLIKRTRLGPDAVHKFDQSSGLTPPPSPITHVRLTIYPDGGVSRVHLWGRPTPEALSKI
mmetsp:Transcript_26986/g.66543  ORF Transcript_26986/g.66543 Transcript_26986/m.66543 type:complete len:394 (+) Transcript_26986:55-1236(+)